MIRRDKTTYRSKEDSRNWNTQVWLEDEERQKEDPKEQLKTVWEAREGKANATESEKKDWAFEQRVMGITAENPNDRFIRLRQEALKENERHEKARQKVWGWANKGQSVEEFQQELADKQNELNRIYGK